MPSTFISVIWPTVSEDEVMALNINEEYSSGGTAKKLTWLAKGVVTLIVLLTLYLGRNDIYDFLVFMGNREAITAYLQSYGMWGPVLLILILSAQVAFAVIPGHIIMITSGYLYGFSEGLLLNLIGMVLVSQIAFVAVRWAGRPLIARLVPAQLLNRWDQAASQQGFVFFLFFFWFPVVPSNVMNFVAALSSISFWSFLAANFFGRLPGVIGLTLIGSHGLELSTQQWLIIAVVGLGLFLTGRYITNKLQKYYLPSVEETHINSEVNHE